MNRFGVVVALLGVLAAASQADASHFIIGDVMIDGVPLDSAGGPTDPTIMIAAPGVDFTLSYTMTSSSSGSAVFDFTGAGVAPTTPLDESHFEAWPGGTVTRTFTRSFTAAGTWTGTIAVSAPGSPTYQIPGAGTTTGRTLSVTFVVNPEPGTIALFGLGIAGLGGFALRRRRAAKLEA